MGVRLRKKSHRCRVARVLLAILCLGALAGGLRADALGERIDALLNDPNLKHGLQGVVVKSLASGATLYERNADLVFIPASNQKLLVSATALEKLGPDFTYETCVYAQGKVNSKGVLEGDLVLKGGGDPTLRTADLTDLARQVRSRGITKVTGDLVADDSLFDSRRLGWGWSWDDLPYYYSAEISALNLNRNVVDVFVQPGRIVGSAAVVKLEPPTDYMTIDNAATTGAPDAKRSVWVDRPLGVNTIRIGGTVPLGAKVTVSDESITVKGPALYAGSVFKDRLARQGVLVLGKVVSGRLSNGAEKLAAHRSEPLSTILALLNKPSDNLIAEVLLKTLGAVVKGNGTTESGAEVATEFFQSIGMDVTALRIVDGSGLSRLNYVSPRNLVTLLTHMHGHKNAKVFMDSLPVAGVDGTLRNRMKGSPAEKNVRAKTGYVSRVSSLSGYITTRSGEPLVFSILMNHHLCSNPQATAVQNAICEALAGM
jgi:D-alanyl-D-alanine carboxypeptidase/D-alanyl-D-alanine-endopeptidase (penicillin-binding protein 4)